MGKCLAETGDLDRAKALVSSITDPYCQVEALFDLTRAVADAGDFERALAQALQFRVAWRGEEPG